MTAPLTIAPPGAVCQVCRGSCAGEPVDVAPGTRDETWYVHRDAGACVRVVLPPTPDRLLMLDLCCGLGGASQAMRDRG